MGDMLKEFVKNTMNDEIKAEYPHIRHPAWMYARVTEYRKDGNRWRSTKDKKQGEPDESVCPSWR